MYVCLCKGVTESHIVQAMENGAKSIKDLRRNLGVSTQCGRCACTAKGIVKEFKKQAMQLETTLFYPV